MPLLYKKYKLPNIICPTHKVFTEAVNYYIFQLVCKNKAFFNAQQLDHKNIHNCNGEPIEVNKLVAPFWENNQLGVVAYTNKGIELAEIWLKLLKQNYPHLAFFKEETYTYAHSYSETFNYYQSRFWMPTSNELTFDKKTSMWYNHTSKKGILIMDFVGRVKSGLEQFFIKNELPDALDLLKQKKTFLALSYLQETPFNGIGYKKEKYNTSFNTILKTNIILPKVFHIGSAISYGNGCFISETQF